MLKTVKKSVIYIMLSFFVPMLCICSSICVIYNPFDDTEMSNVEACVNVVGGGVGDALSSLSARGKRSVEAIFHSVGKDLGRFLHLDLHFEIYNASERTI